VWPSANGMFAVDTLQLVVPVAVNQVWLLWLKAAPEVSWFRYLPLPDSWIETWTLATPEPPLSLALPAIVDGIVEAL